MAPLLPKLRGHFAEFLGESYLAPLRILYVPTCVGFGYRDLIFNIATAFLAAIFPHSRLLAPNPLRVCLVFTGPCDNSNYATQEYLPACHRLRYSLRLRSGLTLHGRTFWRNPWAFGVRDSHPNFRYLSRHSHFYLVHICLPLMLHP